MLKEYHITFSIDSNTEGAKSVPLKLQREMLKNGAEFISKNDDYDGFIDIVYHHVGTLKDVTESASQALGAFSASPSRVSVNVYEHNPRVLIDPKDAKEPDSFNLFLHELAKKHNSISVSKDDSEPEMLSINFSRSKDRIAFQNEYTSKAEQFMNKGQDSVNVYPTWDDITVFQRNNHQESKRTTKYGY